MNKKTVLSIHTYTLTFLGIDIMHEQENTAKKKKKEEEEQQGLQIRDMAMKRLGDKEGPSTTKKRRKSQGSPDELGLAASIQNFFSEHSSAEFKKKELEIREMEAVARRNESEARRTESELRLQELGMMQQMVTALTEAVKALKK